MVVFPSLHRVLTDVSVNIRTKTIVAVCTMHVLNVEQVSCIHVCALSRMRVGKGADNGTLPSPHSRSPLPSGFLNGLPWGLLTAG